MERQKLFFKKNIRLLFSLLGMVLVFFTWSFLLPKTQQAFEAKKNQDEEVGRLGKLEQKLRDLEGLNEFELQQRTELSLKAIPSRKKFLEVLVNLNKLANEQGLLVESFQVTPGEYLATPAANLSKSDKLDFKISLSGSLESLKNFLSELQKTLPLLGINKIKTGLKEDIAQSDLILATYYLPLPTSLGPLETPVPKLTSSEENVLAVISGFTFSAPPIATAAAGRADPFSF